MRVYLVRHGQTAWSRDARFCGTSDPPLTGTGERQARALARRLLGQRIGRILTSPRSRTARTAVILADALDLPWEIEPRLGETDFGEWEGLTRGEIAARSPEVWRAWQERPHTVPPPGGENARDTWRRVQRALRRIGQEDDERSLLVVAHRTVNRILLSRLLGLPLRHYRRLGQDEACLNVLELTPPLLLRSLLCLNDTCHLQSLGSDDDSPGATA
jgi:broad specificity phosphatase PhoE